MVAAYDEANPGNLQAPSAPTARVSRKLAAISAAHVPAHAIATHARVERLQQAKAKTHDDPLAAKFEEKYLGKLLYENDEATMRTYVVIAIRWVFESKEWVAESAIVEQAAGGAWETPPRYYINKNAKNPVLRKDDLVDFTLADLTDPSSTLYGACVDEYAAAHLAR
jgi:hypothetical protein